MNGCKKWSESASGLSGPVLSRPAQCHDSVTLPCLLIKRCLPHLKYDEREGVVHRPVRGAAPVLLSRLRLRDVSHQLQVLLLLQ